MPHIHDGNAETSRGDKLERMTGQRGEDASAKAARIAGAARSKNAHGDGGRDAEEVFTRAPARQISNYGTVKGD